LSRPSPNKIDLNGALGWCYLQLMNCLSVAVGFTKSLVRNANHLQ